MKNKFLILFIALATLASCSDKIELIPEDQLTVDAAFSNETLALGVLSGAYSAAQQDSLKESSRSSIGAKPIASCVCGNLELWESSDTASTIAVSP